MQKGAIRVQTENIFPIIKKFLYSDHDIFLRELVSNAVDATQKLKTLASVGEFKGDTGSTDITVALDTEKKTITISDRGIGMTAEEVDKYINQVAFSGAEEFVKKYKGQGDGANIIGHFGLGFYSSFMVSGQVEIITKSWKPGATAVRWECDGSPEYQLEETEKAERGTDIVLHINEESEEFLDEHRIRTILEKFCRFLPVPIKFQDTQINNTTPAWVKKPSELTADDYQNFYKELYPFAEPPLFWIHLNVDYPFNLTGILYFPKITKSYEIQKDKISLYSNQVFVTDEVKNIVPEFLMLLHGVIDSPDIPLNVSRSYLQGDPNVKKINAHITKKVADKLDEMFRADRKSFEEKWEHIALFVKYGMMTEEKFLDKANKFHLMEGAAGGTFYTLEEYRTATAALQTNKENKLVVLYATNPVQQDSYVSAATAKGFKVVKLETMVDAGFINHMEQKWENVQFTRVDADIPDNLIDHEASAQSVLSEEQEGKLKELFGQQLTLPYIKVELKGLGATDQPVIVTRGELMRRMKDMAAMGGSAASWYAGMPDEVTMTVNANHPIYQNILQEGNGELQQKQVRNLADLALLSQNLLTGADLTAFVQRSVELMGNK
ncbi:molecular chaperone HtpG [Chitinophaga sp. GCM10012297]|uniref:Molecular chaperone HtpG n=1 Tax=Chitinophaga chungangae TaxID=2821488 RepID=A0ABS3Y7G5_9BACT|nr:molecular chaperone HtpG [Chitinophaga chungangae]MBO9150603.1 molecular chaperone HtpG [Chitinophaga chungangae]